MLLVYLESSSRTQSKGSETTLQQCFPSRLAVFLERLCVSLLFSIPDRTNGRPSHAGQALTRA